MTQQEVDVLIDGIIIDNTTSQVSPAKVRAVLKAINNRVENANPASVFAASPLSYNPYTNNLTIAQASDDSAGYLPAIDFKSIRRVFFGEMRIFDGPDKDLSGPSLQIDDVALFIYKNFEGGIPTFFIGAYKGGDVTDIDNNWTLIMSNLYK